MGESHLDDIDRQILYLLRYNQSRGIVGPTPLLAALEPLLDAGHHTESGHLTPEDDAADGTGRTGTFHQSLSRTLSTIAGR